MILFHHRAENGCRGWTRTTTLAFKGRCPAIRRPGNHIKWWAREDLHLQGSQILDLWGLLFPLNHSPEMVLPAGRASQALRYGCPK